jgi:hypothetical protein
MPIMPECLAVLRSSSPCVCARVVVGGQVGLGFWGECGIER